MRGRVHDEQPSPQAHADVTAGVDGAVSVMDAPSYDGESGGDAAETSGRGAADGGPQRRSNAGVRCALIIGVIMIVSVGALAGWLGRRAQQSLHTAQRKAFYVQIARQAAVNLTTIDWQETDRDVERILDDATGTLHDDFANRSQAFIDVVR
jgi:Mce-associated membrane protein